MLQIAICDDEQFYREKLGRLLNQYLQKRGLQYVISDFASGEEFLEQCTNRVKYDIVFLDISMEKVNGVQTAQRIRAFQNDTSIVFVTAFIDYALEGYKVDAVRYILKDSPDDAISECMDAILQKRKAAQVVFSFLEGEKKLYTDNILYVESRKHKVVFFYRKGKTSDKRTWNQKPAKPLFHCMEEEIVTYQIYDKLDAIEERLSGVGFLRIHKSYLVNMKHIRKISNYTALLDTGMELPVPRTRYQAVREAFVAYKGAL